MVNLSPKQKFNQHPLPIPSPLASVRKCELNRSKDVTEDGQEFDAIVIIPVAHSLDILGILYCAKLFEGWLVDEFIKTNKGKA